MWTGHALISRQKEINFRVQAVQRQVKMTVKSHLSNGKVAEVFQKFDSKV